MSKRISSSKKGFTLIEILIVITLMAFLATAALGRSLNAQREFAFLDRFKQTLAKIREPRLYAVTNYTIPDGGTGTEIPQHFEVTITESGSFYEIQAGAKREDGTQYEIGTPFQIDSSRYELDEVNVGGFAGGTFPENANSRIDNTKVLQLIFEPPYADFSASGTGMVYYNVGVTTGPIQNSIILRLKDLRKQTLMRYIVIFQGSGVAEGFYPPSAGAFVEKITGTQ